MCLDMLNQKSGNVLISDLSMDCQEAFHHDFYKTVFDELFMVTLLLQLFGHFISREQQT